VRPYLVALGVGPSARAGVAHADQLLCRRRVRRPTGPGTLARARLGGLGRVHGRRHRCLRGADRGSLRPHRGARGVAACVDHDRTRSRPDRPPRDTDPPTHGVGGRLGRAAPTRRRPAAHLLPGVLRSAPARPLARLPTDRGAPPSATYPRTLRATINSTWPFPTAGLHGAHLVRLTLFLPPPSLGSPCNVTRSPELRANAPVVSQRGRTQPSTWHLRGAV
jgi:hypothetical protein